MNPTMELAKPILLSTFEYITLRSNKSVQSVNAIIVVETTLFLAATVTNDVKFAVSVITPYYTFQHLLQISQTNRLSLETEHHNSAHLVQIKT